MKKMKGIPPKNGELFTSFYGYDFWLTKANNGWLAFKIVSQKPRLKANWYLSYNGERFAKNRCSVDLDEYNQLLKKAILEIFEDDFDCMYQAANRIKEGA